jgi:hypothetical protein
MNAVNATNLSRSLFQITTGHGKKRRVCGNGFVFSTGPEGVLALTPFSTRISPNGRDTNLSHQARFNGGFFSSLVYLRIDNPQMNFALARLERRGSEKMVSPAPLSLKLPPKGAQITCEKFDGSFPTTYGKPEEYSSEPNQILFNPMVPSDFIGSAVAYEGKIIGMACRPFYQPGPLLIGMVGAISMFDMFDFLMRGAQGLIVHPDGHKYHLPPEITAVINRIAEENCRPILF